MTPDDAAEEHRAYVEAQGAVYRAIRANGGRLPDSLSVAPYFNSVAVQEAMRWWQHRHRPAPDETVDSSSVTTATALSLFSGRCS